MDRQQDVSDVLRDGSDRISGKKANQADAMDAESKFRSLDKGSFNTAKEASNRAKFNELWLNAIGTNLTNQALPRDEILANVVALVEEAKKFGVPKEAIGERIVSAGSTVTKKNETEHTEPQLLNPAVLYTYMQIAMLRRKEYQQAEKNNYEMLFSGGRSTSTTPEDLMLARARLPHELGIRFDAHGIAKGNTGEQLKSLIYLLQNGPDTTNGRRFHSTNLYSDDEAQASAIGAVGPYTDGAFIVLGPPRPKGDGISSKELISNSGVAGVLVNREWFEAIDYLQRAFPNVKFIRSDQMKEKLQEWVESVD